MFLPRYSIFIFTFIALIIGSLSSTDTATDPWYQGLIKSNLNPPGYVFGIVWPILYVLMSIAAFRTFNNTKNLFLIQLVFNALWSWLFFAFQMPFVALLDIWLLIYLNIKINLKMFYQDKLSGFYLFHMFYGYFLHLI